MLKAFCWCVPLWFISFEWMSQSMHFFCTESLDIYSISSYTCLISWQRRTRCPQALAGLRLEFSWLGSQMPQRYGNGCESKSGCLLYGSLYDVFTVYIYIYVYIFHTLPLLQVGSGHVEIRRDPQARNFSKKNLWLQRFFWWEVTMTEFQISAWMSWIISINHCEKPLNHPAQFWHICLHHQIDSDPMVVR